MNVTVFGTGYVGLVQGAVLADVGHHVLCIDVDAAKVAALRAGRIPIHEPGLDALVQAGQAAGRLRFSTDAAEGVAHGELLFLAVGFLFMIGAVLEQGGDQSVKTSMFWLVGAYAPASFLSHFTVFVLACFIGYMVIWNVKPSLHTPLMSVTNAISSIIAIGALIQVGPEGLIRWLAVTAIALTAVNMFGGFAVTQRMLQMFRK